MKKLLVILLALFLAAPIWAKKVVIYHTSDTHGFYYARPAEDGQMIGGFAALKSLINKEKEPFLLLDSGDFSDGTLEATRSKGIKSVQLMNAVGYDAATLGNHDFYFKAAGVYGMLKEAAFPVLAANIYDNKTSSLIDGVQEYKIFEKDGAKIAVIGLAKGDPKSDFKYMPLITTLKKVLAKVEQQNPDIVILLNHYPLSDPRDPFTSKVFSAKLKGKIHLSLGGHAHKEQNVVHMGTLFIESNASLKKVNRIEFDLDDANKIKSVTAKLIPLYISETGEDAKIKALAESMRIPGIDSKVGSSAEFISQNPVKAACVDTPADNLIADIMLRNAKGADIAVQNIYGSRSDIFAGPLTDRDIIGFYPFDNKIMLVETDGLFIKRLFINSIKKDGTSLFNYAGLEAKYKQKNGKIKDVSLKINGAPLEDTKKYVIAVNDYIGGGGSEGWMFQKIPAEDKKLLPVTIPEIILKEASAAPLRAPAVCRLQEIK